MLLRILHKNIELLLPTKILFLFVAKRYYAAALPQNEYQHLLEILKNKKLLDCKGELIPADVAFRKKPTLAYYFSASWCMPCKQLLPKIKAMYKECHDQSDGFELLYVSMDEKEDVMVDYFKKEHGCNWNAIPFGDTAREYLLERFDVENVPKIITVRVKDGFIITKNGRKDIEDLGKNVLSKWNAEIK